MHRLAVTLCILSGLLGGCQTVPPGSEQAEADTIPPGSRLTLTRSLQLPAHTAGVYIQGGQVLSYGRVRQYYPHCRFELRTRLDTPRSVEPETFRIDAVRRELEFVEGPDAPVRVAGLSLEGLAEDGPLYEIRSVGLYLQSERQGDVYRMICRHWATPPHIRELTIAEVREALGDLFTLQLGP